MSHAYSQHGPSECPPDGLDWTERYDAARDALEDALETFTHVLTGLHRGCHTARIHDVQNCGKAVQSALDTLLAVVSE